MRNKDEFKSLVQERAAAQRQAATVAVRRRKMILSGVAALVLCIAIVPLTFGLLTTPADVAEDGNATMPESYGTGNGYPHAPGMTPDGADAIITNPDYSKDSYDSEDEEDHDSMTPPPAETDEEDGADPGDEPAEPDPPPFSDDPPESGSPVLDSITDPVVGISAVNRLVGLTPEEVDDRDIDEAFRKSYLDFAVKLFQGADGIRDEDNLLFSPLSAMQTLAMTAGGAEGQTLAEMEALLCGELSLEELNATLRTWVGKMADRKYSESVFSAANSIWVRNGVFNASPAFLQTNANYYKADFYEAPFDDSTVNDINLWIKHHTNGMIEKMVDEIGDRTMMYLINTLYLEAAWSDPYYDGQLSDSTFHGAESDVTVTMMSSEESTYLSMDGAVGFNKRMNGYTFAAILPDEGTDVDQFIASLTGEQLQAFLQSGSRAVVHAKIPSFSYDSSITLTDVLKPYIPTAMSPASADFSNMGETVPGETLFVGSVQQNTTITVGKNGICAAAGTVIDAPGYGGPPPDTIPVYHITLDRPFVYVITDSYTGLPIFIGVVEQL